MALNELRGAGRGREGGCVWQRVRVRGAGQVPTPISYSCSIFWRLLLNLASCRALDSLHVADSGGDEGSKATLWHPFSAVRLLALNNSYFPRLSSGQGGKNVNLWHPN